jgi:FKBP-type peptidyl-prolyl cis-trans isomerase FkpA
MKKYLLVFSLVILGLSSCKKSSDSAAIQAAADDATIQAYIKANNITNAIKDPSGLYYKIITPGTGPYPTSTSSVTVSYTGMYLDGTILGTGPSSYYSLAGGVILGWQIGIPHINAGGTILLLIPSALAYGPTGSGNVAANACLSYTIGLQGFIP